MSLPNGAAFAPGELERVSQALKTLNEEHDKGLKFGQAHAPREISVKVVLRVHRDYPKHIRLSEDKTVIVNSAKEEQALRAQKDDE